MDAINELEDRIRYVVDGIEDETRRRLAIAQLNVFLWKLSGEQVPVDHGAPEAASQERPVAGDGLDREAIERRAEFAGRLENARLRDDLRAAEAEVERLRAESVPRSALVQVGERCPDDGALMLPRLGLCSARIHEPVYVLRPEGGAS